MSFENTAWNSGRHVGQKPAFSVSETVAIADFLRMDHSHHDLCLFMVAVDSMLRCCDVLKLRVRDIAKRDGTIRQTLRVRQQKTSEGVEPVLTEKTRKACAVWIAASAKRPDDFLFTRGKDPHGAAISPGFYRRLVKSWATAIGLDPTDYSSHSLRRTKPAFLYRRGVGIEDIAELLGHKSTESTLRYIGITAEHAQAQALAHDLFSGRTHRNLKRRQTHPSPFEPEWSDDRLDDLADRVAERLLPEIRNLLHSKSSRK